MVVEDNYFEYPKIGLEYEIFVSSSVASVIMYGDSLLEFTLWLIAGLYLEYNCYLMKSYHDDFPRSHALFWQAVYYNWNNI